MFSQLLNQSPKLWKNVGKLNGRQVPTNQNIDFSIVGVVRPEKFFRYTGSLTTPPCSESVSWTVFMNPIPIHSSQANDFKYFVNLGENRNEISYNSRPIQKVNKRDVYSSVKSGGVRAEGAGLGSWMLLVGVIFNKYL